jgi:hypothetical protein
MAEPNTVLVFDGVFLLRPESVNYWDFTTFEPIYHYLAALATTRIESTHDPTFGVRCPVMLCPINAKPYKRR